MKILLALGLAFAANAAAQIATDGSAGARVTLTGPQFNIPDTLGTRAGANLLHSFNTFNVRNGESATFQGPAGLANIIARVTGGSASAIDGALRVSAPDANLYLVNPSGLVFGPGATLDVPGAFHASTGHTLRFADGSAIDLRAASPVTLSAAPPAAFGFESMGAPLAVSGSRLAVRDGRTLALSAGNLTLEAGARLIAPSGSISIASNGDVSIDHATLDASTKDAPGRGIDIAAAGRLTIDASNVLAVTTGSGNAGSLRLAARDIAISGGSLVDTSCDPGCTTGRGGDFTIVAGNGLTITGNDPARPTFVVSNSFGGGATGPISITTGGALSMSGVAYIQGIALAGGDGSSITLRTGSIDLSDGAQVDASTRGTGRGGNITVQNTGDIRIAGTRVDPAAGKLASGIFVNTGGSGRAGGIVISTATLRVLDGGEISSTAQRGSTGDGGRIEVRASGLLRIAGTDAEGKSSGIVANTFSSGAAGEIELAADRIEIAADGRVQTQSEGAGRANTITLRARELSLTGRGQVSSDARGSGDGGTIDVAVAETLTIEGVDSGIFAKTYAGARGGSIRVAAGDIAIARGGIFAGTDGSGAGGNVSVDAARSITVSSDGSIAANARSTGFAGNVRVAAGDTLTLDSGGNITTEARSADGGDITVSAGNFALLDGGRIATEVGTGQGGGGNVAINVPTLVLRNATVSANAFGGPGGNIRIGTQTLFKSADSTVSASSQLGIDGTITLDSPALDPTGELLAPSPVFLDAGAVLSGRCGARLAGRASSLVVAPRGDSTAYPDELRPVLDGFTAEFLTRPAPASAACEEPAKRWPQFLVRSPE